MTKKNDPTVPIVAAVVFGSLLVVAFMAVAAKKTKDDTIKASERDAPAKPRPIAKSRPPAKRVPPRPTRPDAPPDEPPADKPKPPTRKPLPSPRASQVDQPQGDEAPNEAPSKREPLTPAEPVAPVKVDPRRKLIEAFLAENLNDPNYQPVKWFPARPSGGCHVWTGGPTTSPYDRMRPDLWRDIPDGGSAIRFKFRSKNALGATILADKTFVVVGDEVGGYDTDNFAFPEQMPDFKKPMEDFLKLGDMFNPDGSMKGSEESPEEKPRAKKGRKPRQKP